MHSRVGALVSCRWLLRPTPLLKKLIAGGRRWRRRRRMGRARLEGTLVGLPVGLTPCSRWVGGTTWVLLLVVATALIGGVLVGGSVVGGTRVRVAVAATGLGTWRWWSAILVVIIIITG